jgi:hypothetical protein
VLKDASEQSVAAALLSLRWWKAKAILEESAERLQGRKNDKTFNSQSKQHCIVNDSQGA